MSDSKSVALKRHGSLPILLQEERSPKRRYCGTGANQPNIQTELTSSSKAIQTSIHNGSTHLDLKCSQKVYSCNIVVHILNQFVYHDLTLHVDRLR